MNFTKDIYEGYDISHGSYEYEYGHGYGGILDIQHENTLKTFGIARKSRTLFLTNLDLFIRL